MMNSKRDIIYAFIDFQNLKLGASKDLEDKRGNVIYTGWKLDYLKFRHYLRDKFKVSKAYIFIGYVEYNEHLYKLLKSYGYELVFKQTIQNRSNDTKGNVDAELVLHAAAIEYSNYDKAVFVSGDGDFACLYSYLAGKNKLFRIVIPNNKSESSLLITFQKYKIFMIYEKDKLEFK